MTTTDGQPTTTTQAGYADSPIRRVTAENGIEYAHGFLFQHHGRFAADVDAFLATAG